MNTEFKRFLAVFMMQLTILLPVSFAYIYDIQVNADSTTATVRWKTTTPSDSRVDYGTTSSYGLTQAQPNEITEHLISLSGLTSGTQYYYRIRSVDSSSQLSSEVGSFTTKDNIPPQKVQGLRNGSIGTNALNIYWNPVPDADVARYVIYRNNIFYTSVPKQQTGGYITGLSERISYTFSVAANDTSGNLGPKSDTITLQTKDSVPPQKISGLTSGLTSNSSVSLMWDRNGEADFKEYIIYRDNIELNRTSSNSYTDRSLSPNRRYTYHISAADDSGNVGEKSDSLEITTTGTAAGTFAITNVFFRDSAARWTTNDFSNSTVYYGLSSADTAVSANDRTKEHTITLSGLEDGRKYYYFVESCTAAACVRSSQQTFIAGYSSEIPGIDANIPEYHNMKRLNINGTTKELSSVQVYVNDVLRGSYPNTGNDGRFFFPNVLLDESSKINIIRFFVRDYSGLNATREYTLNLDTSELFLNLSIPPAVATQSLELKGSISRQSDIKIYVIDATDSAPGKAGNLSANAVGNSIKLKWNSVNGTDKYLIYRTDVGLLAVTPFNFYTDSRINRSKTYTYMISSMDRMCREGDRSDSLSVVSQSSADFDRATPENASCTLAPLRMLSGIEGSFTTAVQLKEGRNLVRVEAKDVSGAVARKEQMVLFDTRPVQIISPTDIGKFSPVYSPEVRINGQINKKATVQVFINRGSAPSYSVDTDDNGYFTVKVDLTNYNTDRTNKTSVDYTLNDPTASRTTNIRINAVDYLGRESPSVSGDIDYAICSYGFAWKINQTKPMPDILLPSLIRQGIAQIGISYAIGWQGGSQNHTFGRATIKKRPLSGNERPYWDDSWISNLQPIISHDGKEGYVSMQIKAIDPFPGDKAKTEFDREKNISDHRFTLKVEPSLTGNQYHCSLPGYGCVKIPLMMEITFYEGKEKKIQRQCWDVEVSIDRRPDPGKIPRSFLEDSVSFLNSTIELIDAVLEPLEKIMPYMFYGCVASMAVSYVWEIVASAKDKILILGSKTNLNPDVARKGGYAACYEIYGKIDNQESQDAYNDCKKLAESAETRYRFSQGSRYYLCDRIFSPAVPTFQKYVKDNQAKAGATSPGPQGDKFNNPHICSGLGSNGILGANDVTAIYGSKGKESVKISIGEKQVPLKEYCTKNIVYSGAQGLNTEEAKKLCCLYSYLEEWSGGCPYMDIDKESACIAAEIANDAGFRERNSCKTILGDAAKVCLKKGEQKPYLIETGERVSSSCTGGVSVDALQDRAKMLYLFIKRPDESLGQYGAYSVKAGVIVENYDIKAAKDTRLQGEKFVELESTTRYRETVDFTAHFSEDELKKYYENGQKKDAVPQGFRNALAGCVEKTTLSPDRTKEIFDKVIALIGSPDQQYVVDPTSGLINSIRCLSLPSIKGHLDLWRNILSTVKTCFETILTTGDGSAGVCRSVVSVYLCDIMYDLISCFMKNSKGLSEERRNTGIGGVFAAMSNAGSRVASSIQGRYGETNTFNALFGERKLIHAICTFAFTGDWVFDMNAAIQSSYNVPVKSEAWIAEANRRFISYNPVAIQNGLSGLTTYNYHLALFLIAGSDINYNVKLCCSADYSCTDDDYATGGRCDCAGGARTGIPSGLGTPLQQAQVTGANCIDITGNFGPGALKRGEILNKEVDFVAQSHYTRYDQVVLEYSYSDPKNAPKDAPVPAKKHISLVGGTPPAFCSFDMNSFHYRCSVNIGNEDWVWLKDVSVSPIYSVGEDINVIAEITNKIPQNSLCTGTENCEYTKYMTLEIRNGRGKEVFRESDGTIRLNSGETRAYSLPFDFRKTAFRITSSHLAGGNPTDDIFVYESKGGLTKKVDVRAPPGSDFIFGIRIVKEGNSIRYKICDVQERTDSKYVQSDIGSCGESQQFGAENTIDYRGLVLRFPTASDGDYSIIRYRESANRCSGDEEWTATVRIYSAKERGTEGYEMSNQLTYYQGKENMAEKKFKVKCPTATSSSSASQVRINRFVSTDGSFDISFDKTKSGEIDRMTIYEYSSESDPKGSYSRKGDVMLDMDEGTGNTTEIQPIFGKFYRAIIYGKETGREIGEKTLKT